MHGFEEESITRNPVSQIPCPFDFHSPSRFILKCPQSTSSLRVLPYVLDVFFPTLTTGSKCPHDGVRELHYDYVAFHLRYGVFSSESSCLPIQGWQPFKAPPTRRQHRNTIVKPRIVLACYQGHQQKAPTRHVRGFLRLCWRGKARYERGE